MSHVVRYHRYGGPEVLTLEEVPTPDPGPGQVRIRVRAAGINAIDWKLRSGALARGEPLREPAGVGVELSGTIDAVGPGTRGWRAGQDVLGQVATGAAADHVLATPDSLVAKPGWLAFEQAAALPVAAETAYRTLRQLDLREGQTLLIHAVAGGVGMIAAQLARAWGARVIGTASPRHHAFLRQLGAQPVTYRPGAARVQVPVRDRGYSGRHRPGPRDRRGQGCRRHGRRAVMSVAVQIAACLDLATGVVAEYRQLVGYDLA